MNQFSLFDHASDSDYKYNNQSLFSDHYLDEILRREKGWQEAQPAAASLLDQLRQLYTAQREQLPHYNESQLEDNWFRPILEMLGHTMEGQPTIPGLGGGIKKPDYVFFPDETARLSAVSAQNSRDYSQNALAVAEVKGWEVNLDRKTGKNPTFADNNPMYQIDTYLRATGLEWGILSNGRFWRLVHKESAYRLDCYLEIDLLAALENPGDMSALATLTYFTLFFRQDAFRPDNTGQLFLNHALDASRAYARALEADLRDNAYRALEQLIRGFFAANAGRLDPQQTADREKVYRNSLFLLYRLLFLLYGESRGLLPMDNPIYAERYSLSTITTDVNQRRNAIDKMPTTGRSYWNRLGELFRLISGIDPRLNADLNVPRYNGGLFLPERHSFLEQQAIGDRYLVQAIDYLAYRRVRENGRFSGYQAVDYRTLSERQLGSIYEGLLEYRVSLAETEMVTVRQGGVETWLPAGERGRATVLDRRQPGELYMATDKGERKATGSYYTPDYIVKYIVEQTLGPLVEGIRKRVKTEIDGRSDLDEAQKQDHGSKRFVAEILALNVLDPAMGSGHFLVEATSFLARALATDPFVSVTDADDGPQTTDHGPQTIDHGPQTTDDGRSSPSSAVHRLSSGYSEADLTHWRRRVVEACIYGVDKNEMAVELAKLSLWLVTAAADKPLSFLDHHLRHGDSLVGAWLADLERPPLSESRPVQAAEEQAPLFDESAFTSDAGLAVKGLLTIERLPSEDIEDVYAKERTYRQIRAEHLARWRELANLWVSAYFGNTMSREEYRDLALRLQGRGQESMLRESQAQPYLTHPALDQPDYFHWELEFPEVFFDEYGRARGEAAGFDVVVGNPPYGTKFRDTEEQFVRSFYKYVEYRIESYVAFMELALNLTRLNGWVSLIVPDNWMYLDFTERLRHFITSETLLKRLIALPATIFPDATVDTSIYVLKRTPLENNPKHYTTVAAFDKKAVISHIDETVTFKREQRRLVDQNNNIINPYLNVQEKDLLDQLIEKGQPLSDLVQINYGLKAYQRGKGKPPQTAKTMSERPFTSATQVDNTFAPFFEGQSASRYMINWAGDNWIKWGEWLAEPRNSDLFEGPRLLFRKVVGERLIGTYYEKLAFSNTLLYVIKTVQGGELDAKALLAMLNSQLIGFAFRKLFAIQEDDTFPQILLDDLASLPIACLSFTTPQDERTAVVQTIQSHYEAGELTAVLDWCAAELANGRNDTIHDLLAYLAGEMIRLNKAQQALVARFWLDLEGVLADPDTFNTLRHKGKWAQSLHKKVPAARPYVDAGSRSTISLEASLGWPEEAFTGFVRELAGSVRRSSSLVDVYRDHAGEYGRLAQQLQSTDDLIDQVVYRLYGLTAEEIAIVEGT